MLCDPDHDFPQVDGYTLTERLEASGCADVYRAIALSDDRPVVIQVLRSPSPSSPELARLRNHYHIAKQLPLPGVVTPIVLETWPQGYGLVLEAVGGIPLRHYWQNSGRLSVKQVIAIALQLAEILRGLSQHQVVHHAIQPDNILIHPDSHQIWLTNFGLASFVSATAPPAAAARPLPDALALGYHGHSEVLNTPEQTEDLNWQADYHADAYRLGCTLYECLTGVCVSLRKAPMTLLHSQMTEVPKPLDHLNPQVPEALSTIVLTLMEPATADAGYQSVRTLKTDLMQCLSRWTEREPHALFDFAQAETRDRFLMPGQHYGRAAEMQALSLLHLNLKGVKQAMSVMAYASAYGCLNVCLELLLADSWQTHFELTLEVYNAAADMDACQLAIEQLKALRADNNSLVQWLDERQAQLHGLAVRSPQVYQHRYDLLCANNFRFKGDRLAAIEAYDLAIERAHEQSCFQDAAHGNEQAAQFYAAWGKEKISVAYLQAAYQGYVACGAETKAKAMERRYPKYLKLLIQSVEMECPPMEPWGSGVSRWGLIGDRRAAGKQLEAAAETAAEQATERAAGQSGQSVSSTHSESVAGNTNTSGKNAGKKLRFSQFALDHASDYIFCISSEGLFLDANLSACKRLGYSLQELRTLSVPDVDIHFPPSAWKPYWQYLKQCHSDAVETYLHPKSGQPFPVAVTCNYVEFEGEEFSFAVVRDVSDRKAAERAIQKSEKQFRSLVSSIDGAVYQCQYNRDWTADYVSSAILELAGYPAEDFIQSRIRTFASIIHPDDREHVWQSITQAANAQTSFLIEYRMVHRNGEIRWVSERGKAIYDSLGQVDSVEGVIFDISDRKKIAKELEFAKYALDRFSDCMYFVEATGKIVDVNQASCDRLGYDYAELCSLDIFEFFPQRKQNWAEHWTQLIEEKSYTLEATHKTKSGELFPVEITCNYLEFAGKGYNFTLARDISARKAAAAQLQRTNEELARATRLKDEFLANMSHELRTPLNAILGMTEGLQDQAFGPLNKPQLSALKTVEKSGFHLLELINEILDLAKIESGQMELVYGAVPISRLCDSSQAFVKQQALKKNIQLHQKLSQRLPRICVDERRIRQVLINLLNNAVKFTPEGGRITLTAEPILPPSTSCGQGWLRLSIADTGIGIAADDVKRLFHPFVQIDSALNRQYEGTGLGLALVKRIVDLHGGKVSVTSDIGVGSCFTIELPYEVSRAIALDERPVEEARASALPPQGQSCPASPLILLAEDNEANIRAISSYLEAKGYDIQVARTGQSAIEQAQAQPPNIILMDVQMPEMDGLSTIQHIRQLPALCHIPIIALTALAMDGDEARCLAAGATLYLSKPVKLKQLVLSIQEVLCLSVSE